MLTGMYKHLVRSSNNKRCLKYRTFAETSTSVAFLQLLKLYNSSVSLHRQITLKRARKLLSKIFHRSLLLAELPIEPGLFAI